MIERTIGEIHVDGEPLDVKIGKYDLARRHKTAVVVEAKDGEPYAIVSVNTEDDVTQGEFVLARHNLSDNLYAALEGSGLFQDTGKRTSFGYVNGVPIWRLKDPQ